VKRPPLSPAQLWQIALITAVALALFIVVRRLPTGTNLGHMDFRVAGGNSIEFCDPANPQFLPVVAVPSPVTMTLSRASAERDRPQAFGLTLRTFTGKPIGPADLAVAHTRKLHLLVIDPSLQDYQHVHPEPGDKPGEWRFSLMPRRSGLYRVFADFVPLATGRGLYAVAEFTVPGPPDGPVPQERSVDGFIALSTLPDSEGRAGPPGPPSARSDGFARRSLGEGGRSVPSVPDRQWASIDGYDFTLVPARPEFHPREVVDLTLAIERADGGPVPLGPVMGAFAHLVAFDEQRRGFAHLHPNETDLARPPDAVQPRLTFKVTLPRAGIYVVWAQVNLAGREVFVPFTLQVR